MITSKILNPFKIRQKIAGWAFATPIHWGSTRDKLEASGRWQFWVYNLHLTVFVLYLAMELGGILYRLATGNQHSIMYLMIDILHECLMMLCCTMTLHLVLHRDSFVEWFNQCIKLDRTMQQIFQRFAQRPGKIHRNEERTIMFIVTWGILASSIISPLFGFLFFEEIEPTHRFLVTWLGIKPVYALKFIPMALAFIYFILEFINSIILITIPALLYIYSSKTWIQSITATNFPIQIIIAKTEEAENTTELNKHGSNELKTVDAHDNKNIKNTESISILIPTEASGSPRPCIQGLQTKYSQQQHLQNGRSATAASRMNCGREYVINTRLGMVSSTKVCWIYRCQQILNRLANAEYTSGWISVHLLFTLIIITVGYFLSIEKSQEVPFPAVLVCPVTAVVIHTLIYLECTFVAILNDASSRFIAKLKNRVSPHSITYKMARSFWPAKLGMGNPFYSLDKKLFLLITQEVVLDAVINLLIMKGKVVTYKN